MPPAGLALRWKAKSVNVLAAASWCILALHAVLLVLSIRCPSFILFLETHKPRHAKGIEEEKGRRRTGRGRASRRVPCIRSVAARSSLPAALVRPSPKPSHAVRPKRGFCPTRQTPSTHPSGCSPSLLDSVAHVIKSGKGSAVSRVGTNVGRLERLAGAALLEVSFFGKLSLPLLAFYFSLTRRSVDLSNGACLAWSRGWERCWMTIVDVWGCGSSIIFAKLEKVPTSGRDSRSGWCTCRNLRTYPWSPGWRDMRQESRPEDGVRCRRSSLLDSVPSYQRSSRHGLSECSLWWEWRLSAS